MASISNSAGLGTDPAPSSGIAGYDVAYKIGAGNWTPWLTDTDQTGGTFRGSPDTSYTFRVRVKDQAGNPSPWVESSSLSVSPITKYYTFGGQKVAMRRGSQVYYLPWRSRVSKLTWINFLNNQWRRNGHLRSALPPLRSGALVARRVTDRLWFYLAAQ